MDFLTQYNEYQFERNTTVFSKGSGPSINSGSIIDMGGAFVLLSAKTNALCRLRLYSDEPSMITDSTRPLGNFNLTQSVALIADIVLTDSNLLTFNPPIIGNTFIGGQLWYNLSGSSIANIDVQLESYPIKPVADSLDGNTNIEITGTNVPTTGYGVSGSITTPKSYAILKAKGTYNYNVDQQWERGDATDDDGWKFLQTRALTRQIESVDPKVTVPFTEISTLTTEYAAKIATRTGTLLVNNSFYQLPVDVGDTYRISGWVYATYDGTDDDTLFGNYDCGFYALALSASNDELGYIYAKTTPSTSTSPSWKYVSTDFAVGADTASIQIGTWIDGPYPAGYGYGAPVCTSPTYDLQPLVCPGYGWFTGFTVENITDTAGRVRLYSTDITDVPLAEQTRPFGTEPNSGSNLITDMIFSSASFDYPLVPILEAYTRDEPNYSVGVNRTGYILENLSTVAATYSGSLNVDFTIYSLED